MLKVHTDTIHSFSCMCPQAKLFTNTCTFQSSRPYLFDLMKSGAGDPDGWGGNLSQTGERIQPQNHSRHQLHVYSARVRRNLPCWAGWQQWCCSSGSAALLFGTPGSCRCNDNHKQTSGQTHGSGLIQGLGKGLHSERMGDQLQKKKKNVWMMNNGGEP